MRFQLEGFFLLLFLPIGSRSALDFTFLGTVQSPRLHLYHSQLIKKLAHANNKVSTLISNRATSVKVRKYGVEVHPVSPNCQRDTITSHQETCHPSKSELSEAEAILSRNGNVEQMVICFPGLTPPQK